MAIVVDPDGVEIATILALVDIDDRDVLDVGCGNGRMSLELARHGARVFGIDPDADAIATARSETPRELGRRVRFEAVDAAQIELPRGEYDLAMFSWSL